MNQVRSPHQVTEDMRDQLRKAYRITENMAELEGQDRTLTLDMSQAMLGDIIQTGKLRPVIQYVRQYCDVLDSPEDAERIAELIQVEW